jgi:hypothetical protein
LKVPDRPRLFDVPEYRDDEATLQYRKLVDAYERELRGNAERIAQETRAPQVSPEIIRIAATRLALASRRTEEKNAREVWVALSWALVGAAISALAGVATARSATTWLKISAVLISVGVAAVAAGTTWLLARSFKQESSRFDAAESVLNEAGVAKIMYELSPRTVAELAEIIGTEEPGGAH